MAECEAGLDSVIEAKVLYPNGQIRILEVPLMDIHGTDFTVEEVKNQLLENPQNYELAFKIDVGTIINVDQRTKITEYIDFLTENIIIFVKK